MLGDLLRETRKQKNLSLEDVEKGTNIRKLYIKSIEDGNYEKLPGEVFLKGFIKTYGKFLGLDSQQLINQYKSEKNATTATVENTAVSESQSSSIPIKETVETTTTTEKPVKTVEKNIPKLNSFEANQEFLQPHKSNNKKNIFIIILILIIIIGGAIFFLSSQETSDNKAPVHTTEQQTPQAQEAPQAPAPVINEAQVKANFTEDCWTEVKVDGNVVLSETVKKGANLEWKGTKQIDITVGNAGAVDITFNNQTIGKLGDIGAVVTKSFVAPNQDNTAQPTNNK